MPRRGQKSNKGQPELYDEVKKRVNITITPTGWDRLDDLAWSRRLSKSELIEQIARGEYLLVRINEAESLGKPQLNLLSRSG